MKVLPNKFYTMPNTADMTMTTEDLKELLLETDGRIMTCGGMYAIVSNFLGAGVYRVWLVKDLMKELRNG